MLPVGTIKGISERERERATVSVGRELTMLRLKPCLLIWRTLYNKFLIDDTLSIPASFSDYNPNSCDTLSK